MRNEIDLTEKEIALRNIIIYLIGMTAFSIIVSTIFILIDKDNLIFIEANTFLFTYFGLFCFLVYYNKIHLNNNLKSFMIRFKKYIVIVLISIIAIFLLNILIELLFDFFDYNSNPENQQSLEKIAKFSKLHIIIPPIFFAPLVEELIFRRTVFSLINNTFLKIFLSGFIFGLIHILSSEELYSNFSNEIWNLIPYMMPGIILAIAYHKSNKNIFVPITIHTISNIIAVASMIYNL